MRNPSLNLLGLAAFSSALLVGCGGGGSNGGGSTNDPTAEVTGGASMATKVVVTEIPSSSTPAAHDFGGTTAMIPAGITIPANCNVAIVGTSKPVLGLQGSGAFKVNGGATGITLKDGSLSSSVALPPTNGAPYGVAAVAPTGGFLIPASNGRAISGLTINESFTLGVPVLASGTAGFPTKVTGTIPTNGATSGAVSLNVFYPQAFAGYSATLSISWKVGKDVVTLAQTKTVAASGVVNFTARSPHTIPSTGVDTISLALNAPN